jgi:hypothetical protein
MSDSSVDGTANGMSLFMFGMTTRAGPVPTRQTRVQIRTSNPNSSDLFADK